MNKLLNNKAGLIMNKKILIVEDEIKLSEIMTLYLKRENYDVICVYHYFGCCHNPHNKQFFLI